MLRTSWLRSMMKQSRSHDYLPLFKSCESREAAVIVSTRSPAPNWVTHRMTQLEYLI